MPRLTPARIKYASRFSRHLPLLLRECRDLDSAKNELRWIKEFVAEKHLSRKRTTVTISIHGAESAVQRERQQNETLLGRYVKRRARGEPLQYILGTQPFGNLDILCRPNVLIPRPETEHYTAEAARLVQALHLIGEARPLCVADFCSGSGCISLLLHSIFRSPQPQSHRQARQLQIRAFDVSHHALNLARDNIAHNIRRGTLHESARREVQFEELDILALSRYPKDIILDRLRISNGNPRTTERAFDVIISNPPYISPEHFKPGGQTTRSVRKYEPELALVPPASLVFDQVPRADQFYAALLHIASAIRPKLLVMEVGDTQQALRVRDLCERFLRDIFEIELHDHNECSPLVEIWRDDGSIIVDGHGSGGAPGPTVISGTTRETDHTDIDAEDHVDCRAVVLWLDPAWSQRRRTGTIS